MKYLLLISGIVLCCNLNAQEITQSPTPKLYDQTTQTLLQLMNGAHFMSQGGIERVDVMVKDIDLKNKVVLDFGSGLGGPALHLAQKHQALVTGVDIDQDLVQGADAYAHHTNIADRVSFITYLSQTLPFQANKFDVVFSKESIIHVADKSVLFKEFDRVLKPGGNLVILDWFWQGRQPSQDLLRCLGLDGFGTKMHYVTVHEYVNLLTQAGFSDIEVCNTSPLHLNDIRQEAVLLRGDVGNQIKSQLGQTMLDSCLVNWDSHIKILESGEIETYLIRAKKHTISNTAPYTFLQTQDLRLRARAVEVSELEIYSQELVTTIEQMLQIARGEQVDTDKRFMVGLAAPQLGIAKRIIVVDMGLSRTPKKIGELMVFINPEIIWRSDQEIQDRDSCYSVDERIAGIVSRAQSIRVRALDQHGIPVIIECSDMCAKVFQHEIDHLDGILFSDRIGQDGVLHWVEQDLYPGYRHQWQDWPTRCSWDTWLAISQ